MPEETTPSNKETASPQDSRTTPPTTSSSSTQQPSEPSRAAALHKNHAPEPATERWQLVWDLVIFQGKLLLDAGRDLLLSPLSIILAIFALITGNQKPGRQFYDLMHIGHRTDKWINLFGAANRTPPSEFSAKFLNSLGDQDAEDQNVDDLVNHMEEMVKKQYEKGGVTANAKINIDKAFDKLNAKIHPENKKT